MKSCKNCPRQLEAREEFFSNIVRELLEGIADSPLLTQARAVVSEYQRTGVWKKFKKVKSPETTIECFCKTCLSVFERYLENTATRSKMFAIYDELTVWGNRSRKGQGRPSSSEKKTREIARAEIRELLQNSRLGNLLREKETPNGNDGGED